jgi:adenylosuccinate synthase
MAIDVLLGLQWGDEGKGKIVDVLAPQYDIICRFQGGPNAGHTLIFEGKKHVLHTVPSGIFRDDLINVIGNGVVLDPITFQKELEKLDESGVNYKQRLLIAKKAHLILPTHRMLDAASEASKGDAKIGSTLKGIGPTYMDKTGRNGLRVGDIASKNFKKRYEALKEKHLGLLRIYPESSFDLAAEEDKWFAAVETLKTLPQIDCEFYIHQAIHEGKSILAEGAQGSMLDVDYGTYPYVTSSNTITAGVCIGLGVPPSAIGEVIGITKAYCTRVGSGPFPTELENETGEFLRSEGAEFGSTTGRPRRCGWLDLVQLRYTCMLNGVTKLVLTKTDVLNKLESIEVCNAYNIDDKQSHHFPYDLDDVTVVPVYDSLPGWKQSLQDVQRAEQMPEALRNYIEHLTQQIGVPFAIISTGPDREELFYMS